MTGTSFGLDYGPDSLFAECQECPHRALTGQWVRDGEGYRRETALGEDAALELSRSGRCALLLTALDKGALLLVPVLWWALSRLAG